MKQQRVKNTPWITLSAKSALILGVGVLISIVAPLLAYAAPPDSLMDILSASGTTASGDALSGVSAGLFTPPLADKSVFLLQQLFGSVGNVLEGTGSQIVGQMFAIFNLGVWVVAGGLVMYTTLMSIVNTAKDGQFLGRSQMSAWVAVRTVGGIAMLLPKFTGYSFIQVLVISVVLQGIGLADHLWSVAVNYVASGGSIYELPANPSAPNGQQQKQETAIEFAVIHDVANLLRSEMCYMALDMRKRELAGKPPASPNVAGIYKEDRIDFGPNCGTYYFPRQPANTNSSSCLNRENTINTAQDCADATYPDYVEVALRQATGSLMPIAEQLMRVSTSSKEQRQNIQKCLRCISRSADLDNQVYCLGSELNEGNYCSAAYQLIGAESDVLAILASARRQVGTFKKGVVPERFKAKDDALKSGWLMAGSYFFTLTDPTLRGEALAGQDAAQDNNASNFRFTIDYPVLPSETQVTTDVLPARALSMLGPKLSRRLQQAYRWLGVMPENVSFNTSDVDNEVSIYNSTSKTESRYHSFVEQARGIHTGLYIDVKKTVQGIENVGQKGESLAALIDKGFDQKNSPNKLDLLIYNLIQTPVKKWVEVNLGTENRISYEDPIRRLRTIGMSMVNAATVFWQDGTKQIFKKLAGAAAGTGAALVVTATGLGFLGAKFPAAADALMQAASSLAGMVFQIVMAKYFWYLPLGVAISVPIFVMGLSMSVYTPMIPYIIFTFASIGWLISVIEAMVAAPLVALGVTHPQGHDLMGKAEQALMLLLSVFLRPAAILLGFIFGIILSFVALNLLDQGFFQVMVAQIKAYESAPDAIFAAGTTNLFVGLGGLMMIYTLTVTGIVNQSFSTIYALPAKLLRWIGGPMDDQAQMIAQMQQQVQSGFKDQAQQMGSGGGQMVQGMKGTISPPSQSKAFRRKGRGPQVRRDGG